MNVIKVVFNKKSNTCDLLMREDYNNKLSLWNHLFSYNLDNYKLPDEITDDVLQKFVVAQFTNAVWSLPVHRESK